MITAIFSPGDKSITTKKVMQWDYGQVLSIKGLDLPNAVEIHFCVYTDSTTIPAVGITTDDHTDVEIPDGLLRQDRELRAYVYVADLEQGKTVRTVNIPIQSRQKPEIPHTPEDTEVFREAIKAVNDSADRAETAANTSEQNAKKTAEDRKTIEEMVETVSGIEQQVQDVKKYAGQAETAAENALLSEQEAKKSEGAALQHRTGAETAENNAELAESNAKKSEQAVEQAKQLVMQMGQEVLNNKNQVDGKVEEFNKTVKDASDAIETVKTDAIDDVEGTGTEQTKKVADEGAKQVKEVEDKGNEVLQSIPKDFTTQMESKLNKQQGAENNGKILGIGADGNVIPVEKPSGGGKKDYELISEITTSQEIAVIEFKDFQKAIQEYIFYISCPKAEPISVYIQRVFDNQKHGRTVILYSITATDKETDTYVKGEIISEKIEVLEHIANKWNNGNLQIAYHNTFEDKTPINASGFLKLYLSCTNQSKFPIGTKITLLGR